MWAELEAVHQSDVNLSRYIHGLFHTHAEDGENISEHLNKLLQYREGINLIANRDLIPDLSFKRVIAASLPPSWHEFVSPYVEGEKEDPVTPLQPIGTSRERGRFLHDDSHLLGKNRCDGCGKFGHVQDECWFAKNKKRKRDINAGDLDKESGEKKPRWKRYNGGRK